MGARQKDVGLFFFIFRLCQYFWINSEERLTFKSLQNGSYLWYPLLRNYFSHLVLKTIWWGEQNFVFIHPMK